jgi:hypothetical protein
MASTDWLWLDAQKDVSYSLYASVDNELAIQKRCIIFLRKKNVTSTSDEFCEIPCCL